MKAPRTQRAHRVQVIDEIAASRRFDYTDAFEVQLPEPDLLEPRTWLAAGLKDSPAAVKLIKARLLGEPSEPATCPDEFRNWRVIESTPDLIRIEQSLPLLRAELVGRRLGSSGRRLSTLVTYERPMLARLLWTVLAVVHRRTAGRLICHGIPTAKVAAGGHTERAH